MAIQKETAGYKRWAPMLSFEGKTREGAKVGRECFRNVDNGVMVFPEKGWNGDLDKLEHGDLACVISASDKYRQNYDLIQWDRPSPDEKESECRP